jgi:hypothetical protein
MKSKYNNHHHKWLVKSTNLLFISLVLVFSRSDRGAECRIICLRVPRVDCNGKRRRGCTRRSSRGRKRALRLRSESLQSFLQACVLQLELEERTKPMGKATRGKYDCKCVCVGVSNRGFKLRKAKRGVHSGIPTRVRLCYDKDTAGRGFSRNSMWAAVQLEQDGRWGLYLAALWDAECIWLAVQSDVSQ